MDERFRYLLDRLVKRQISEDEKVELKYLLGDTRYAGVIKEDLSAFLARDFERLDTDPAPEIDYNHLYDQIRSEVLPHKHKFTVFRNAGLWTRVAAVLVVAVGIGYMALKPSFQPVLIPVADTQLPSGKEKTITFRSKDFIRLPDGSTVLLNENSELSYTEPFGGTLREVTLKGEAYFDIKPDANHAFVVRTGAINTRVLGTAFNVNAREKQVVVTVTRGLVEVGDENRTFDRIRPNERLVVNTLENVFKKTELKDLKAIQWKDENVIFDGVTLETAVKKLEDKFDVKVVFENPQIKNCRISAWFLHSESLTEILDLVCGIRQASYTIENSRIRITGGIGCDSEPGPQLFN